MAEAGTHPTFPSSNRSFKQSPFSVTIIGLFFKYLLFIPVVILLVNSFSLGNGFEFIFYLFISFSLSINTKET
jgi:hypothetical protein